LGVIQFEISESDFSRKLSSNYELSILHRMDSFVFMATDQQQRLLLLRDCRLETSVDNPGARVEELQRYIAQDSFLRQSFRSIRMGIVTEKYTLIPNRLFNPQEKNTYLEQITILPDDWQTKSDDLNGLAAQNVYAYPTKMLQFAREHFPGSRIYHIASAFLLAHRSLPDLLNGQKVFAHIWNRQFQLIYYEGRELQFVNMFSYHSSNDFIYYLMLLFDQFDLDPQTVPVYLSGQINTDSEIYRLLTRYVQEVATMPAPAFLSLGKAFHANPAYHYYDLFALLPCS